MEQQSELKVYAKNSGLIPTSAIVKANQPCVSFYENIFEKMGLFI